MLKATIIGKPMCVACQNAEWILDGKGYKVTFANLDADPDAMALFSLLDGDPDNLPLVILRGLPPGNL